MKLVIEYQGVETEITDVSDNFPFVGQGEKFFLIERNMGGTVETFIFVAKTVHSSLDDNGEFIQHIVLKRPGEVPIVMSRKLSQTN